MNVKVLMHETSDLATCRTTSPCESVLVRMLQGIRSACHPGDKSLVHVTHRGRSRSSSLRRPC
jgi:hypothetical protein